MAVRGRKLQRLGAHLPIGLEKNQNMFWYPEGPGNGNNCSTVNYWAIYPSNKGF